MKDYEILSPEKASTENPQLNDAMDKSVVFLSKLLGELSTDQFLDLLVNLHAHFVAILVKEGHEEDAQSDVITDLKFAITAHIAARRGVPLEQIQTPN